MSHLLRKSDVVSFFAKDGKPNFASVGRAFRPILGKELSRISVGKWPEYVPELRARQLLDHYPDLKEFVLDPVTLLTATEMRKRISAEQASP